MSGDIVVFGATGYTGELVSEALVEQGVKPVLAARSQARLDALSSKLGGGLETRVADVGAPDSVRAIVSRGDVLVATVGPFVRWGAPAVEAAIAAGAHYLDSTGEGPFIADVFERYGGGAQSAGCGLVTAFGYDWVPGNLAAALAVQEAGPDAVRVDTGYFITGGGMGGMSGGTRASAAGVLTRTTYTYRDGRLVDERGAKRVRTFDVRGHRRPAISVGSSEQFALPAQFPQLREVNTYLGWFGGMSRFMQVQSAAFSGLAKVPGFQAGAEGLLGRVIKGSTGGPDAEARAAGGSHVLATAYDSAGRELATATVTGVSGYTFTGRVLAWGAQRALTQGLEGTGALGPTQAFGIDGLREGCAAAGLDADVTRA
jgi:short subunit dehydrogenase-like uncharacterized protein